MEPRRRLLFVILVHLAVRVVAGTDATERCLAVERIQVTDELFDWSVVSHLWCIDNFVHGFSFSSFGSWPSSEISSRDLRAEQAH